MQMSTTSPYFQIVFVISTVLQILETLVARASRLVMNLNVLGDVSETLFVI